MGARVASLCGAVLPGKVLQEEGGWGEGGLQGGQGGGQGGKAAQLRHFRGEEPHTTSLYRGNI